MEATMSTQLYSPRPLAFEATPAEGAGVSVKATNLTGQAVAIVDNGKLLKLGDAIESELRVLGAADVLRFRAPRYTELASVDFLDSIAAQVTGAVIGLGN
jgi:hypothetical protein